MSCPCIHSAVALLLYCCCAPVVLRTRYCCDMASLLCCYVRTVVYYCCCILLLLYFDYRISAINCIDCMAILRRWRYPWKGQLKKKTHTRYSALYWLCIERCYCTRILQTVFISIPYYQRKGRRRYEGWQPTGFLLSRCSTYCTMGTRGKYKYKYAYHTAV